VKFRRVDSSVPSAVHLIIADRAAKVAAKLTTFDKLDETFEKIYITYPPL